MNKPLILWIASLAITGLSAYYQRVTGPTYPMSGEIRLGSTSVPYRLERSHSGLSAAQVRIHAADTVTGGIVFWKRFRTDDPWMAAQMWREGEELVTLLPPQRPAGKIAYFVRLKSGSDEAIIPSVAPAVMRFRGEIPPGVLILHIALMFIAMLFSTRAGLEIFGTGGHVKALTYATIGLLLAGGMVLGPIVQKYAFGQYWTGWPFGTDLTDNKTVAAIVGWICAASLMQGSKRPARWVCAAAIITLAVYMIPHSLFGSELDYRKESERKSVLTALTALNPHCSPAHHEPAETPREQERERLCRARSAR